jgi:hypothetical protein
MHDIYDYLQKEFQKIKDLFKKFDESTDIKPQQETFLLIKNELTLLEESEKATFYKMLEEHGKTKSAAEISEQGFSKIKNKIEEIINMPSTEDIWRKHVLELRAIVNSHFESEEKNLFIVSKNNLSEENAVKLKTMIHDYRNNLH